MAVRWLKLARELEEAIAEGDTARVVERVSVYGLTRVERAAICRQLVAPSSPPEEEVRLRFNVFDQAHVAG